jgi:hypothetical protein
VNDEYQLNLFNPLYQPEDEATPEELADDAYDEAMGDLRYG